jgi:hypothetical protein
VSCRVQLGVYLRVCSEVKLRLSWELNCERIVEQAGSMPSSAIGTVLDTMLGRVLQTILRHVLGRVLGVALAAYSECSWKRLAS